MAADRVPQMGEVWVLGHLRGLGRGRVTIEVDPADVQGRVVYRFQGTGNSTERPSVAEFVRDYEFMAVDEQTADLIHGPQLRPSERKLADMPIRLGTAVD